MCAPCTRYNTFFISLTQMLCMQDWWCRSSQSTCVHTRHVHDNFTNTYACQLCTRQNWFACIWMCIWIVSQGWQYKLYDYVLVLRHDSDSNRDTRRIRHYEFLTVKLKPIYHIWGYAIIDYHCVANSPINYKWQINADTLNVLYI